ncbi:hypothetical protein LC612_37875 [Nostoc sp. CHAB 5834]|nr:hypothetical protein [Nostoc sp. CHAB 5834]
MNEHIHFMSQRFAKAFMPAANTWLISIRAVGDEKPDFEGQWERVLYLEFADLNDGTSLTAFKPQQAKEVLAFAREAVEREAALAVHCHAGVSRSGAVAMFLAEIYELKLLKEGTPCSAQYRVYNTYVYRLLHNEHFAIEQNAYFQEKSAFDQTEGPEDG